MDSKTNQSTQKDGFTLTEVIVAMGILGFGLLALMQVLSISLRYQRQNINNMNAARVNDMVMERVVAGIHNDTPAGVADAFWASQFSYPNNAYRTGTELVGRDEFHYAIYAVDVPGIGDASLDPPNTLRKIDAYVWWKEKGEAGQKRTFTTRLMARGEEE